MNDQQNLPLSNGEVCTKIMNNNTSPNKRKLILHFDNRNTLQVNFDLIEFFNFIF